MSSGARLKFKFKSFEFVPITCSGGTKADGTASGAFPFGKMTVDPMGLFSAGAVSGPFITP